MRHLRRWLAPPRRLLLAFVLLLLLPATARVSRTSISSSNGRADRVDSPSICRFAVSPIDARVAMAISENASELRAIDVSEAALLKRSR